MGHAQLSGDHGRTQLELRLGSAAAAQCEPEQARLGSNHEVLHCETRPPDHPTTLVILVMVGPEAVSLATIGSPKKLATTNTANP